MSPLLKPLNTKEIEQREIRSLLSSLNKSSRQYPLIERECLETIKNEGRLLILPLLSKEESIRKNKLIHQGLCERSWARCGCQFAKTIRLQDIGLNHHDERLRRII